jgi:hypothetical protein
MTYWIGMLSVLLLGYGLIKWSGRVNEQANEGSAGLDTGAVTGELDARSTTTSTPTRETSNSGEDQSYNGGEA